MSAPDATVRQRWTALGLDRPELGISPDQTITAKTLAAPAPAAPRESADPPALPHISIDERGPLSPGSGGALRADLSVVATLGEGGMGRVHLARQRSLDREVAIKTLKQGSPDEAAAALLHEARLTGALEHPGVIPVHALGVDDAGRPILVMKRVEGVDWSALLADPSHPAWAYRSGAPGDRLVQSLEILAQVSQTVEFAHSRGVFHRDIKPENVMIGRFGEVLLVDWGVAKTAAEPPSGLVVGTPVLMAPEMARGDAVDARTDVYLLGATLHEVLTGRGRHEGRTLLQVLEAAVASASFAYGPEVPAALASLCNRATAREPNDRVQSAHHFRDAVLEFLRNRSALALSDAASARLAALESVLAEAPAEAPPADLAAAYGSLTEARFGFAQSLREHPGNAAAQRGLRACSVASIDLELRQNHAETARALLRDLGDPETALVGRVEAAEQFAAERSRSTAQLEAMAKDLDASVGRRSRSLLTAALAGALTLIVVLVNRWVGGRLTPTHLLWAQLAIVACLALLAVVFRRLVWSSAINRRLTGLTGVVAVTMTCSRAFGAIVDGPIAEILWRDLLLLASFAAAAAIALLPRLGWAALPAAVAVVAIPLWPAHTVQVFSVAVIACVGLGAHAVWRTGRPSPPGPGGNG